MANFVEKENIFIRIAKYLIPWKGDKPGEIIRKIIFLTAAVTLAVTLIVLVNDQVDRATDTKDNEELSEIYHGTAQQLVINTEKQEELQKEYPTVQEQFLPLLEINEDVIGWITVGDSSFIDYVVMQGDDNNYYLTHNYKGEESKSGSLFVDYHNPITAEEQPANIVVYGHNMASGEYFGKLPYYFNYSWSNNNPDDISFYQQYPTITFSTLYKTSTYKIFGGMLVNTEKEAGKVFKYHMKRTFKDKADFDNYCAEILDRSTFINPDVNLKYGDNLLTLSTCMFGYGDADLRWVIFARETREGESPEVDVSKAYANPSPKFYDLYYELYAGKWLGDTKVPDSWQGRGWKEDIIADFKQ